MSVFKNFWNWLDGKKTIIATIFWSVAMPALNILYPNGIPSNINKVTLLMGLVLSSLGLGHKAVNYFRSDSPVEDETLLATTTPAPKTSTQGK
jgi:hypothetical protein